MKAVIQRSKQARVKVNEKTIGEIEHGFVVLLGISADDTIDDVKVIIQKLINLRIFEDDDEKMNLSLLDVNGGVLSISQFTLYADVRKGRRPNFMKAAHPTIAEPLYNQFNALLKAENIDVQTGEFGAMMDVSIVNTGPVTITIETEAGKIIE